MSKVYNKEELQLRINDILSYLRNIIEDPEGGGVYFSDKLADIFIDVLTGKEDSGINKKFGMVTLVNNTIQFFANEEEYNIYIEDPLKNKGLLLGKVTLPKSSTTPSIPNLPNIDLSNYVTRNTDQDISGIKNFLSGIKLNNSPIITYDSTTKSWLLEGNLIVTGGGAFRATLGDLDVPTIMDAINTDEVTISKEGGILKVLKAGLDREELLNILSEEKYTTQTWVNEKLTKFALKSDLPDTSTLVDLSTYQEILEVKDFKKGLKLNSSPIITYDSTTKSFLFDGNIVVTGGGVFRAALGDIDAPTIMDAILVDEQTILKEGGILKINPNIDLGGGIKPEELQPYLEPYAKIDYVANTYATIEDLNNFLTGSDTDTIINKWKELEKFLSGLSESDDLATILSGKADKATTLSGYGITDAYTNTEIDTLLLKYVRLEGTAQEIKVRHNFTDGLKIGGLPIYKSQDDVIYIDSNVVISRGLTVRGTDGTTVPSIWESIPFNPDHMSWDGSQWNVVGGGGGSSVTKDSIIEALGYTPFSSSGGTVNGKVLASDVIATTNWINDTGQIIAACKDTSYKIGLGATSGGYAIVQGGQTGVGAIPLLLNPSGGNVAIGGTTADEKLHVHGNILATGSITATSFMGVASNATYWNAVAVRPSSANISVTGKTTLSHFLATGSMTTGKPARDGTILHSEWDNNSGFSHQVFFANNSKTDANNRMQWRAMDSGTWGEWKSVAFTDCTSLTPSSGVLTINGNILATGDTTTLGSGTKDDVAYKIVTSTGNIFIGKNTNYGYIWGDYSGFYATFQNNGNTAIGGTSASEKLEVYGNVKATSFIGNASSATKLKNYYSSRPASADVPITGDGSLLHFKATGSMTTSKPNGDGHILHFNWDGSNGYDAQLFVPTGGNATEVVQYRTQKVKTWGSWKTIIDSDNIASQSVASSTYLGPKNITGLKYVGITKADNSGQDTWVLIADVTNIHTGNQTGGQYGFVGYVVDSRNSGYMAEKLGKIICRYGYTAATSVTGSTLALYSDNSAHWPRVVKYNDRYYLAIRLQGSGRHVSFFVRCNTLLNEFIQVTDSSLITTVIEGLYFNETVNRLTASSIVCNGDAAFKAALSTVGAASIGGNLTVGGILSFNNRGGSKQNFIYIKESGFGDKFSLGTSFSGSDDSNYLYIASAVGAANTDPELTEKIRIFAKSGNVAIGGTTASEKLYVYGLISSKNTNADAGLKVYGSQYSLFFGVGSGNVNRGIFDITKNHWWIYRSTSTDTYIPNGNVAIGGETASEKLHVYGNLLITGGITSRYTSDMRLKQNRRSFKASEVLMSLGAVQQFEYIPSEVAKNKIYVGTHIGLIYQNVVGTALNRMCYKREDGYGSLNYYEPSFISLLAGVGQEHEIRLTENEREIKALKEDNKALRKEIEYLKQRVA